MIAGADWASGSWLVVLEENGHTSVERVPEFSDLVNLPNLELLVIDVPIGLVDRGARSCDPIARRMVRPRHNSVFTAPIRPILSAPTYEEACRLRRGIDGKGCSKQAFGIFPIVAGVDRLISPRLQALIREGHPELSFAYLNGGHGLAHYKGKPEGRDERLRLLEPHFPSVREMIAGVSSRSATVDVLDALAMLWTARRVKDGVAISVPDQPEYDSRGLRMEMVA